MTPPINRIYQGRVRAADIFGGKDEQGNPQWEKLDDWEEAVWRHHEIFQDAVNYYLVALGALADPAFAAGNRVIKDLRSRLEDAWEQFPRSVAGEAVSLQKLVGKWLGLSEDASLDDTFRAVLYGNEAPSEVLTQSLSNLLEQLLESSGDSKIRNKGRQEAPKFFWSKTDANFQGEYSRKDLARLELILTLHGLIKGDLNDFGALDLATASKRSNRKAIAGQSARKKLLDNLSKLKKASVLTAGIADDAKAVLDELPDDHFLEIPAYEAGGASKEKSVGIPLLLIGKQLGFPGWCLDALRKVLIVPPKWEEILAKAQKCAQIKIDPLEVARGDRGYVFRAFTALSDWNPKSPGEPVWKEFDIAAFKEALTSLNQFNQKTHERVEDEANYCGQLAIMLGSEVKGWKPQKTESGEDEITPEPLDRKLFQLARDLEQDLTTDLADTLVGEEKSINFGEAVFKYREGEWRISPAALRGYSDISEEWNKLYTKYGEALTPTQLEEAVKNYQREEANRKSIGSIPLFLRLCEKKYWPLWLVDGEESGDVVSGRPFLHDMTNFYAKFRDFQKSMQPINLTPAEPVYSRRLYRFSDIKDKNGKVVFREIGSGYTVECALAMKTKGDKLEERRVRLRYSAKRLLRDELQGDVESRWLQPMTRALGLKMPESKSEASFGSAVSLMPDVVRPGNPLKSTRRFLLNFPVTLDPSWVHAGLDKASIWKRQFNGARDKNLHLHWPDTIKGKGADSPWWKNKKIIDRGFTYISLDLGQRTAGAWALLRVTCSDPRKNGDRTKRPVREVGFDGDRHWFAEVTTTGILRLPGEDQKVMDSKGDSKTEMYGKAGRNALFSEWEQAKKLAVDLLADNPEAWVGKSPTEKSLPEQNDALIALANRRLSRLSTYHRWSCFDPDRPEVAERRVYMVQKLIDELGHWQDPEVARWREFVEKGLFPDFRSAAGAAFVSLRDVLVDHLVTLANRVAPLRNRSWKWQSSKRDFGQGVYGELLDTGVQLTSEPTWIRGQRGLSLSRIEQLESLRRLFLRYNRSLDREPGEPVRFGYADFGRKSGEPCRLLLEKIDRMKKDRVNQTAHLILAQALGVRLKGHQMDEDERKSKDIHGEYEMIPGREPVDFIVIENLDRYLTSQGRSPWENSRLMKWAHRAVRDKIKMLSEEPFGIPVVETAAAYSSRFCAVTGVAGARCEERSNLTDYLKSVFDTRAKRAPKPGQPDPQVFRELLDQFAMLEQLNTELERARSEGRKKGKAPYSLFLPKQGGPLFMAANTSGGERAYRRKLPTQADINAAINVGLRAVAAPNALSILHKIRAERDGDGFVPILKNAREKAAFKARPSIVMASKPSEKLTKSRNPNFFFDAGEFGCFDSAHLTLGNQRVQLSSGIGLWATVNQVFPNQLLAINKCRLERWQKQISIEDDIPM